MLKCAAIFSNHMVLQRGKPIAVFGEAAPGRTVRVELDKDNCPASVQSTLSKAETVSDENGHWLVRLDSIEEYMTGLTMKVSVCDEIKENMTESSMTGDMEFTDVAVGEVFLAGGQSNMEREMGTALDGQEVLQAVAKFRTERITDAFPEESRIRFYYTQKRSYFDEHFEEDEAHTSWQLFGDEWMRAWSAVGFFFAGRLAAELGCTVGIIGCNWGGTSAACWMDRQALSEHESTHIYVEEYDNSPDRAGRTDEEQIAEYEEYVSFHAEWDRQCGELYATVPGITWDEVQDSLGKCRYPGPMNCASFLRPCGLYETMLKRVAPYTVKGFIYYQGENDDHRPEAYFDMMQSLISCWRRTFEDEEAVFLLTQLTMHRYEADPDRKNWPIIREAQARAGRAIRNCATAVIIDQGEFNEIHPQYKRRVGERLAGLAMWKAYGLRTEAEVTGPCEPWVEPETVCMRENGTKRTLALKFKNGSHLQKIERLYGEHGGEASDEGRMYIDGFEIEAEDGSVYPAEAEIISIPDREARPAIRNGLGNAVRLSFTTDAEPVAVRYLWTNYSEVSLYGETKAFFREPLPVAPFRLLLKG